MYFPSRVIFFFFFSPAHCKPPAPSCGSQPFSDIVFSECQTELAERKEEVCITPARWVVAQAKSCTGLPRCHSPKSPVTRLAFRNTLEEGYCEERERESGKST